MDSAASRFGQRLAHTEKKYRDQALKKLTVYLTKKSEWTGLEWDKLWKALFYCMWMSDKRPIQEELSTNLASLVHKLPTVELSLGFVHSFFRTMHREWHGIDGLRLDKFYSLIRKFVHQSIALLQNNDWEHEHVESFVSILSSEIISQLPNGLRMHLSDLYIEETWKAAGASVETDSFLMLLEPFFTLLSSEYDKTVFKRVRELVFTPMLTDYKFGPQPAKKEKKKSTESNESGETDGDEEEEEEEEDKVFELVDLAHVQHRIFNIASADDTAERNRSGLYDLYSKFFQVTKIDSLKAAQEEASKPKASPKKKAKKEQKQPVEDAKTEETKAAEVQAASSDSKKKKNKKRKKSQANKTDAKPEAEATPETVVPEVTEEPKKSPQKKQKVAEKVPEEEVKATATTDKKKSKKSNKKADDESEIVMPPVVKEEKKKTKQEDAVVKEVPAKKLKQEKKAQEEEPKAAPAKSKLKKEAKEPVAAAVKEDAPAKKDAKKNAAKTDAKQEPEKPKAAAKQIVVKSGMKFQRCVICKGFGKGFLPAAKDICAHCERTQKSQKKAAAVVAKKRKASEIAASSAAAEAEAANSKKVTFGKNKALPHELSVKRLKASAKKEAVPKEAIKGVLKTKTTPPVEAAGGKAKKDGKKGGKSRMKAADFF